MKNPLLTNLKFGSIIWILVFCQIIYTSYISAQHVLFKSNLQLWLNPDYFYFQKVAMMLGGDYVYSQRVKDLPLDANYLVVPSGTVYFLNYYLSPRKLFLYEGISKEEDFEKIPKEWLRQKEIEYVIFYQPPDVKITRLDLKSNGEVK